MREEGPAEDTRRVYVTPKDNLCRHSPGAAAGWCVLWLDAYRERQDGGHVVLRVGVHPALLYGVQALVIARDRLALRGSTAGQGAQNDDAGGDVVLGVEQVELAAGQLGGPDARARDDLHRADRVRDRDLALVPTRLLPRDGKRQVGIDPVASRGGDDHG